MSDRKTEVTIIVVNVEGINKKTRPVVTGFKIVQIGHVCEIRNHISSLEKWFVHDGLSTVFL